MSRWRDCTIAAAIGVAAGLAPTLAASQEIDLLIALPAATLTFSAPFIAEDGGFYKREGLKVSHRTIVGVGSVNAVIAGSAMRRSISWLAARVGASPTAALIAAATMVRLRLPYIASTFLFQHLATLAPSP